MIALCVAAIASVWQRSASSAPIDQVHLAGSGSDKLDTELGLDASPGVFLPIFERPLEAFARSASADEALFLRS